MVSECFKTILLCLCLIDYSTLHLLDPRCIMKAQGYPFFFHPRAPFFTCASPPFAAACPSKHGPKLASVPSAYWTPMVVGDAVCVDPTRDREGEGESGAARRGQTSGPGHGHRDQSVVSGDGPIRPGRHCRSAGR